MVSHLITSMFSAVASGVPMLSAAEKKAEPLLMRLDPADRARVLMALLGLVLVGLALVAFAVMAGRQVLRLARASHGPTRRQEDDWYRKPLVPEQPAAPPPDDPE